MRSLVKQESTAVITRRAPVAGYRARMANTKPPERHPAAVVFGRNVKTVRETQGISSRDLSDRSGVSNIRMIESGRRYPRPGQQRKLARTLGVAIWRLHLDGVGDMPIPRTLQELIGSPVGRSITEEERNYLLALPSMLGRSLSYEGYWKALEMLRASVPDPDAINADDDGDAIADTDDE